jgi:outer membrane protein
MKQIAKDAFRSWTIAALVVLLGLNTQVAASQEVRVAYFDSQRVMTEAPAKAIDAKLEQEFGKRRKELQELGNKLKAMAEKFEKEAPMLNDVDRLKRQRELSDFDQDIRRKQRAYTDDLNLRRNEEYAALSERLIKVVKQVAEAEKFDIVVQEAMYVNPAARIDITDKVLKLLAK